MNWAECKVAIDFSRHHLTHLDPVVFKDDSLPVELFLDYERQIRPLATKVKQRQRDTELAEEPYEAALEGGTLIYNRHHERIPIRIRVVDFDPYRAKFLVANKEHHLDTWRSRLYIDMPGDVAEETQKAKKEMI